jgi:hypothetical protein
MVLDISYSQLYSNSSNLDTRKKTKLINAIRHQNILGWDLFMKGIQSSYWAELYQDLYDNLKHHINHNWSEFLIRSALELYKGIWEDQNKSIHGSSRKESHQRFWERVLQRVSELHHHYFNDTRKFGQPPFMLEYNVVPLIFNGGSTG